MLRAIVRSFAVYQILASRNVAADTESELCDRKGEAYPASVRSPPLNRESELCATGISDFLEAVWIN